MAGPGSNGPAGPMRKTNRKATPLGRQAAKNAYSKSISPAPTGGAMGTSGTGNEKEGSPVRPQVLDFGSGTESPSGSSYNETLSTYSDQDPDLHKDI